MLRLFAVSCIFVDLMSVFASLGVEAHSWGVVGFLAMNGLLIVMPLAYRAAEPLLSALSADPATADREMLADAGFGLDP